MARNKHSGNGHERLHITETPDVSHIKNPDVTHEASDVSVPGLLKFVLGLTVMCVVVFVLMFAMFRLLSAQEAEKEPPAGPMAMTEKERLPPEPRLQAAKGFEVKLANGEKVNLENKPPEAEYQVLREQWERQLNCSDGPPAAARSGEHEVRAAGAAATGEAGEPPAGAASLDHPLCVPINQAMEKVVGLPSRVKTGGEQGTDAGATAPGIDPPTAASSGRTTLKGSKDSGQ
jgi:hypothetical protein